MSPNGRSLRSDGDGLGNDGKTTDEYVLYPVFESFQRAAFELARDIAEGADMTLLVLDFVESGGDRVDEPRHVGASILSSRMDDHDIDIRSRFEVSDTPVQTVVEVAQNHDTHLVIFDSQTPEPLVRVLNGGVEDRISTDVPCDVVTVERTHGHDVESLFVPVGGGPHTELSVTVASSIARAVGASVELFHVVEPAEPDEAAATQFKTTRDWIPSDVPVETESVESADIAETVVKHAAAADVTIIGEPTQERLKEFLFGSLTDEIRAELPNTTLVCRRGSGNHFHVQ